MDNPVSPELIELAERAATKTVFKNESGKEFVVVKHNEKLESISERHKVPTLLPDQVHCAVTLSTVGSMLAYLKRFKTPDTVLFASRERILANLDYYPVDPDGKRPGLPALCGHDVILYLTHSEPFKNWLAASDSMASQADFARFIDENRADISSPDAATVLETVIAFESARTTKFKQVARTDSNAVDFEFSEGSTSAPRQAKVPTQFTLTLPVFVGEDPVTIEAKLRWDVEKTEPPKLKLGFSLMRVQTTIDQAVERVVERLKAADCPIFFTPN